MLTRLASCRSSARSKGDIVTMTTEPAPGRAGIVDPYKDEARRQWDNDPCGSHYVKEARLHTLDWYLEAEAYRYQRYAPWMPRTMEFAMHRGERVLEIGGGIGTDLAQFARHGAAVTDLDLSLGHLALARENFNLRGLQGRFVHSDGETLPFASGEFDLVYSNGVIHHTPDSRQMVLEIHRVLKPGGRVIAMVYAENSIQYWGNLVLIHGVMRNMFDELSIGGIMSRHVELTQTDAKPLVKVYTRTRLRTLFSGFEDLRISKRQLTPAEVPRIIKWIPLSILGRLMGWNLVLSARKPR